MLGEREREEGRGGRERREEEGKGRREGNRTERLGTGSTDEEGVRKNENRKLSGLQGQQKAFQTFMFLFW